MLKIFSLKKLDKKTKIYLIIGLGIILLLILFLVILKLMVGSTINSKTFEGRLKDAAVDYYNKYPDKLPTISGEKVSVTIDELVNSKTLKNPNKLLDKGLTCSGKVDVSNNNGYYLYQPIIECSDEYKTNLLYKKILNDNPTVTKGNGLYKVNDYYLFRGENLNNFASFAGKKWYILRINEDNTIRMIMINNFNQEVVWDNRYNSSINNNYGKNDFMISRIKDSLEFYYNDMFTSNEKALIVPKELCIGARSKNATSMDGSIECSRKTEKLPLGLLQVNEYPIASIDPECTSIYNLQCTNYNYLISLSSFWTLNATTENTYSAYMISAIPTVNNTNERSQARLVVNISADALYSDGDGTSNNPYIIK
jgi:hypothetical protein